WDGIRTWTRGSASCDRCGLAATRLAGAFAANRIHSLGVGPKEALGYFVMQANVLVHVGVELIFRELKRGRNHEQPKRSVSRSTPTARDEESVVLAGEI